MRHHLDAIRDGLFIEELEIIITVSEDWTIKFWSLKFLESQVHEISSDEIHPYYTLRGHTGIITRVAANYSQDNKWLLYTGGIEGIIRVWTIPTPEEVDQMGHGSDLTSKLWVYILQAHPNEIIWDIKHHKLQPLVLTLGADEVVALWRTPKIDEIDKLLEEQTDTKRLEDKLFVNSFEPHQNQSSNDVPTWWEWINSSWNHFAVGYCSGFINLFEINKKSPISVISKPESRFSGVSLQIGWIASHPLLDILIAGTEEGKIKIFDIEECKLIKWIEKAHEKAVSSIKIHESGVTFFSSSHDGNVIIWEINSQEWKTIKTEHLAKFNETVCSLALHSELPILLTCGADGIAHLYVDVDF